MPKAKCLKEKETATFEALRAINDGTKGLLICNFSFAQHK